MIRETEYIIAADIKSRAESTREANTDKEDEVSVTIIFATSRKTLAAKFTKMAMLIMRNASGLW